jgi:Fe2+ transport system protein FeoA
MTLFGWLQTKSLLEFAGVADDRPQMQNLRQVSPGKRVRVTGFTPRLNAERRAHLQAYGVIPGHWVQVTQHSPVTVVRIEQTEIALESGLASEILIGES